MEYFILGALAAIAAIGMWLFWTMLENMVESQPEDLVDRADDEHGLDSIRGALEEQSAPWRPHVRSSK